MCVGASVKYTEVLFAGSDKFSTKKVVRGVQAAARAHHRYGVGDSFARFRRAVPSGVPWPPCDLGAGQERVSKRATAGMCSP